MKILVLGVAVLGLGACASLQNSGFSELSDPAAFHSQLVGNTLTSDAGELLISSDGTISGLTGGEALTGTWQWDGTYCRQGSVGDATLEYECQTIETNGTSYNFIGQDGTVSGGWTAAPP